MIYDTLENWDKYFNGSIAGQVKNEILEALNREEVYEKMVIPNDLIVRSLEYKTLPEDSKKLIIESHKTWIDIQFSVIGAERIDLYNVKKLKLMSYQEEMDSVFYEYANMPEVSINNIPGRFSVFFPWDAHRPGIQCNNKQNKVLKTVIKVKYELFPVTII